MKTVFLFIMTLSVWAFGATFEGHGLGLKIPKDWQHNAVFFDFKDRIKVSVPSHFDWREKLGKQIPVLDQGQCGSCWAFSRVESIMWQELIHKGTDVVLAPQELVSCDYQENGCGGGFWDDYEYDGISAATAFPYVARDVRCKEGLPRDHKITNWMFVGPQNGSPTKEDIKQAIYQYGPVGATVGAGGNFPNGCGHIPTNHMVILTGWDDAKGAWIMQNSWGTDWGNGGYAMVKYGCYNIGETVAVPAL